MTRQQLNEAFALTSFLHGANVAYIEEMHGRYQENPGSVSEQWRCSVRVCYRGGGGGSNGEPDGVEIGVLSPWLRCWSTMVWALRATWWPLARRMHRTGDVDRRFSRRARRGRVGAAQGHGFEVYSVGPPPISRRQLRDRILVTPTPPLGRWRGRLRRAAGRG